MNRLFQQQEKNEERMEKLRMQIRSVVPYFGAGASKLFGYPLWDQLLLELLETTTSIKKGDSIPYDIVCKEENNLKYLISQKQYMSVADTLDRELYPKINMHICMLMENYKKSVVENFKTNDLLEQLGKFLKYFPEKKYLTTNYDDIIKKSLIKSGIKERDIQEITPAEFSNKDKGLSNIFKIYHLHGKFEDPDTIIFSNDSYDDYYGLKSDIPRLNRKFSKQIYDFYANYHFLFIGSGMRTEDRLFSLLKSANIHQSSNSHFHFALLNIDNFVDNSYKKPSKKIIIDILNKKEREFVQWNIIPIWFSSKTISREDAIYELFEYILEDEIKKAQNREEEYIKNLENEQKSEKEEEVIVDDFGVPYSKFPMISKYYKSNTEYEFALVKQGEKIFLIDQGRTYQALDAVFELNESDVKKNLNAIMENCNIHKVKQKANDDNNKYVLRLELTNWDDDRAKKANIDNDEELKEALYRMFACVSFMDRMYIFYV
jgi:hypothetical protein